MKKIVLGIVCGVLFGMSACMKPPTYSIIPALTGVSVSQSQVTLSSALGQTSDSVLVTLNFTDGDGDIGPPGGLTDSLGLIPCTEHSMDSVIIKDPVYNVFWYTYHYFSTDSCLSEIYTAYVPNNSKFNAIKGLLQVYPVVECPPTGTTDTVSYSFFIKDRAGHISNRVRTPKIVITCN